MLSENNMKTNLYLKCTTHTLLSDGTILAHTIQSAVGYFSTVIYYRTDVLGKILVAFTSYLIGSHCPVIKPCINFCDPKSGL